MPLRPADVDQVAVEVPSKVTSNEAPFKRWCDSVPLGQPIAQRSMLTSFDRERAPISVDQ